MTSQTLKGGPELLQFIEAFPAKLQKGAVRAGLTAAAKPIRDQARANIRKKSGATAKAIKTSSSRVNQDGTVSVKVQLKGRNSFIGLFLEYGVSPHLITPGDSNKSAKVLNKSAKTLGSSFDAETGALKIGDNFIRGAIMHPGFAPKPFLRPALDTKASEAVNEFGKRVQSYLSAKSGFTTPLVETADE